MLVFQRAIFIFIFVIPERFERSTHSLEGCDICVYIFMKINKLRLF